MRLKTEELSSVFFVHKFIKPSKGMLNLLKEGNGTLQVVISDDGIGFDKNKIKDKDGIGINQIEARIYMLKGIIKIASKEGGGNKIKINLPIFNVEKKLSHV